MNKNKDPGFDPQPEPTFNEKIFFQLQVQRLQHNGRTIDSYIHKIKGLYPASRQIKDPEKFCQLTTKRASFLLRKCCNLAL